MEHFKFVISVIFIVFSYIAIIGILMRVANLIGELFEFGKFFENLLQKSEKK